MATKTIHTCDMCSKEVYSASDMTFVEYNITKEVTMTVNGREFFVILTPCIEIDGEPVDEVCIECKNRIREELFP